MTDLNSIFLKTCDLISRIVYPLGFSKYCRNVEDLRLVFYHGLGDGKSPCLRYLNDEIPVDVFGYHVNFLSANYDILSLNDSVKNVLDESFVFTKPICSISFDDGLKSVYRQAFPILKESGINATVFLNTAVVGNNNMLWTHQINYLISNYGVDEIYSLFNRFKDCTLSEAPNNEYAIQDWYKKNYERNCANNLLQRIFKHAELCLIDIAKEQQLYLDWDEIAEMECSGITFCSHTQSHAPLGLFENEKSVEEEITSAYSTLLKNGNELDFVSFPFGMKRDYGEKAIRYALDIGHKYVIEVGTGMNNVESVKESKVLARVSLGSVPDNHTALFSAVELAPKLKATIKTVV